jgi:hypothetical protein
MPMKKYTHCTPSITASQECAQEAPTFIEDDNPVSLPQWPHFAKDVTAEQTKSYWDAFQAQRKFFAENGDDEDPEQIKKFWAQYRPE